MSTPDEMDQQRLRDQLEALLQQTVLVALKANERDIAEHVRIALDELRSRSGERYDATRKRRWSH